MSNILLVCGQRICL